MDTSYSGEQVLEHIRIHLPTDVFDWYARRYNGIINEKLKSGALGLEDLDAAMEQYIFKQASDEWACMTNPNRKTLFYMDHLSQPEIFAFALVHGDLPDEEKRRLRFDHGETLDSFIKDNYQPGLPSILRERLLNPPDRPQSGGYSAHLDCIDHCCD